MSIGRSEKSKFSTSAFKKLSPLAAFPVVRSILNSPRQIGSPSAPETRDMMPSQLTSSPPSVDQVQLRLRDGTLAHLLNSVTQLVRPSFEVSRTAPNAQSLTSHLSAIQAVPRII